MAEAGRYKRMPESVLTKAQPMREAVSSGDMGEAPLTTQQRNRLPRSAFALPDQRAYPINDLSHARNALARVAQFGTPEEKRKVKAAVYKKYPQLNPAKKNSRR